MKPLIGLRICCVAFIGLWLVGSAAGAQEKELDLGPVPVQDQSLCSDLQIPVVTASPSENASESTVSEQKNPQQQPPQGTSNDRILWTMPNFLTVENAEGIPPLSPGQKFKVTARGLFDPFEFVLTGFVAGLGQAANSNPSYGQGWQGYGKRYGTSYADNFTENFMAYAVLPTLLHQDPRYYQLGHGGFFPRSWHAVSRVLITRSDSGKTQFNISELGGAAAAAAISTYSYHVPSERSFGNLAGVWGTQMSWDVVTYMIKEFWPDLRKRKKRHSRDQSPSPEESTSR